MNMTIERLKSEMAALPAEDRAELAQLLIQTLDNDTEEGVEATWDTELARRADEIRSGHAASKPADQVFAEIRATYS